MKKFFFIVFPLVAFYRLQAQTDMQNAGILYISGAADILYINGSFTNTAVAGLTNGGRLYVTQNLINGQAFGAVASGTLYLNGDATQVVSGTSAYKTFGLVTSNTAGITLNNNLNVTGVHTYINGIITTSNTPNYLVYEAGSSYVGESDNQHVNGWVKKLGNTAFSFPVGNGTVIRKTAIESLSGSLEFNARYQALNSTYLSVQMPLVASDRYEYWNIDRVDASGSARVHLNWDNNKVIFPTNALNAIGVGYYTGGLWTDKGGSATGNIATTGDIISSMVSAFGNFTFADMQIILPLQFLSITAQRKSGYNLVEWRTADATNTDYFGIERSENGIDFQNIGAAVSYNSSSVLSYSYNDEKLMPGILWYRIRSVDLNGKFNLSRVVSVKDISERNQLMYVLNNPARGSIQLYAPDSYKGKCDYHLISAGGQLIQRGTITVTRACNVSIRLNAGISRGVYILHVKNDKQQFQEKILMRY